MTKSVAGGLYLAPSCRIRATLYRARDGDPRVTTGTLRRIEHALGLPYDTFASVGVHDFAALRMLGVQEGG